MKLFLVSCLLLFSLRSPGQSLTDQVFLAGELFQKGEYAKAIPIAEKVAADVEKFIGKDNMIYISMLTIQAYGYFKTYQYTKSEILFSQLCELNKKSSDPERDQHYAACLNNLANLYTEMGRYSDAESTMLQSLDLTKRLFGENDSTYTSALNNLAGLYQSMGQYPKAEPLYIKAKDIRKKILGENHAYYANSLNNLGSLYLEMGIINKAEPLFVQSMEIRKKVLGESHPDFAMSLNNLGSLYEEMGEYSKAEPFYMRANSIRKSSLGELHPDYAMGLNNLASLYANMKQYKKAEGLLIQSKDTWKKVFGENSPNYALSLNNLAALYRKAQINYPQAETYYIQSLNLRKKILGEQHPLVVDVQNDLALLYLDMKQFDKAPHYFLASSRMMMQNLLSTFPVLSENEKNNYINDNFLINECNSSFIYLSKLRSSDLLSNNANLQLFFKSLSLADTRNMMESARNSRDTVVKRIFKEWQLNKSLLTKQYSLPVNNRIQELKSLEQITEGLEKELARRSSAFREQQASLKVAAKDITSKLNKEEAAVEFIRFRLYRKGWTDSIMYAAYIFQHNDTVPVFVPLCEEKQLQQLFDSAGRSSTAMVNSFYRGLEIKNKATGVLGKELYRLVWEPLQPYLSNKTIIYYSPAGKLYGVAFHALPADSSSLLMDKYELHQYTSNRQLAFRSKESPEKKPSGINLFGDPDFSLDIIASGNQKNNEVSSSISKTVYTAVRGVDNSSWPRLTGTAEEVKKIKQLFDQNKIVSSLYIQKTATEENLKASSGKSPQIIHIATHGYFLTDPEKKKKESGFANQNPYTLANDPLLRSGLIMAGGNNAWSGKMPAGGAEDGILTALEISQLDLSKTELVVLSACETALGDVKGSEGVFGLQRAFKMAGVKKMIVSLWQVPDKETAELMTAFYDHRMNGKTINEAFAFAQADMRKKYPPFYWAAFVLIE